MIELGRGLCTDLTIASTQEWLVTNGLGGYAMGTISGILSRRYHGLLVAALDPPLGRTLLVSQVDETVRYDGEAYALAAHQWSENTVEPRGFVHLDAFQLDGSIPTWTYACGDALLEKRLWMAPGENTTYVRYSLRRGRVPLSLRVKVLVNHRGHHGATHAHGWHMAVSETADGVRLRAFDGAPPVYLSSNTATADIEQTWFENFYLAAEARRGLDCRDDHLHTVTFNATLSAGKSATLVFTTEATASLEGDDALAARQDRDEKLVARAGCAYAPPEIRELALAADQFVVRRPTEDDPGGRSIIAGYPWFGDWGRDTMISLPGLTLATGRPKAAAKILRTYSRYVDRGMLPNRFPDDGGTPEYNTVDATLWYVEAIRAYVEATGDMELVRDLWPVLTSILEWHRKGTRYGIQVDPDDGLLRAGEPGVQLTWMDAKVGDRVVTPRIGKPVEVNALWYNALRILSTLGEDIDADAAGVAEHADRVATHFDRFWDPDRGYCRDVIDGPEGDDPSLRPNQLFAVSLPHSPLSDAQQQAVVDTCAAHLYTPHGLRSLAPSDPHYVGTYSGPRDERDGAYHQGTVWSWLIGPFARAHLRVYDDPDTARSYLAPLLRHLEGHCVGTISEIFDGDPPFTPRGAPAQAWGVAQLLAASLDTAPHPEETQEDGATASTRQSAARRSSTG